MISEKFDRLATTLMVACALVMTGITVQRYLSKPPDPNTPTKRSDWASFNEGSMRVGPDSARVRIVVFSDFQCPFCKRFAASVASVQSAYPGQVQMVFRNFPLTTIHPVAYAAAAAAQCAVAQGKFSEVHDRLFQMQDSLLKADVASIAVAAGIPDEREFRACLESQPTRASIGTDSTAAMRLEVAGTPTVLVNQWRYQGAPTAAALDSIVVSELRARR